MPKLIIFVPDATLEAVREMATKNDTTVSEAVRICIRAQLSTEIAEWSARLIALEVANEPAQPLEQEVGSDAVS